MRDIDRIGFTIAGYTSDDVPVYFGKKYPGEVDARDLSYWVTLTPECPVGSDYTRAGHINRELEGAFVPTEDYPNTLDWFVAHEAAKDEAWKRHLKSLHSDELNMKSVEEHGQ